MKKSETGNANDTKTRNGMGSNNNGEREEMVGVVSRIAWYKTRLNTDVGFYVYVEDGLKVSGGGRQSNQQERNRASQKDDKSVGIKEARDRVCCTAVQSCSSFRYRHIVSV